MPSITIPQKHYQILQEKALRLDFLSYILKNDIFSSPPTKNKKEALDSFRATKKYSGKFLQSLQNGLQRSSYFTS